MVGQGLQPLQAREQRSRAACGVFGEFGAPDIADHQRMAGQDEPRLVRPRAVGDDEAHMLRRMARRVYYIDDDIAERQPVSILCGMDRKNDIGPGVQHISGPAAPASARPAER